MSILQIITLANFCVYSTTICTQIATFLRIKILSIDPSAKSSEPIKPGNLLTTANGRERHTRRNEKR